MEIKKERQKARHKNRKTHTTRSNGAEVLGCDVASGQGNEDQNSAHFGGRLSILVGWICPLA